MVVEVVLDMVLSNSHDEHEEAISSGKLTRYGQACSFL